MKAIVYETYGSPDVLQVKEVTKPTPKEDELLVRVMATPVSYGDIMARNFKNMPLSAFNMPTPLWLPTRMMFGWNRPKKQILGSEFAGIIESTGNKVTQFKTGDHVFGYLGQSFGAYAEYICMEEDGLVAKMPANTTPEQAAAIPYGALTALNLLKKADIQAGQRVLINGASGGIGSAALQIAKNYFDAHVTGVCSTPRMGLVKALGADKVIDYTQTDFTQNGETYDLIIDILGKLPFAHAKNSLNANGKMLYASFKFKQLGQMLTTSLTGNKKVICALSMESAEDMQTVREMVEAGKIKAIVDRCYPMAQASEAHRYVESRQKQGNVIIQMEQSA